MPGRQNPEQGFILIELLVVVAILGVLATIAMVHFAAYSQRAVDSSMESDLHTARSAMESYYEQNNFTYEAATPTLLEMNHGFRASGGVTLNVVTTTPTGFLLRAGANDGTVPSFEFDTQIGSTGPANGACS